MSSTLEDYQKAHDEWPFKKFGGPRTMPDGWDLSALPRASHGVSPRPAPSPIIEHPEIRFSEWMLDPYFDNLPPADRRRFHPY